jgi:hypothetical protein
MDKQPKNCGEVFDLMPNKEQKDVLYRVANVATFAENAMWEAWRRCDPLTGLEVAAMKAHRNEYGKWPKIERWALGNGKPRTNSSGQELKTTAPAKGLTPTTYAKALCPGLRSYVYDAIANQVAKLYQKHRFELLTYQRRLPVGQHLRIRFREKAVKISVQDAEKGWYQAELLLEQGPALVVPIKTVGKSAACMEWLAELAEYGHNPSGGTITLRRKRGKNVWQLCLARSRRPGEREQVKDIVAGRTMTVWAPIVQEAFLRWQIPLHNRAIGGEIEGHDLLAMKHRDEQVRRQMGRHYRQTHRGGGIGHGRTRAIAGKLRFRGRYERRVHDWIENRSAEIVKIAAEFRCELVQVENLSARDPSKLLVGSMPLYRLTQRIEQKAHAVGIKTKVFTDIESADRLFSESRKRTTTETAASCECAGG